VACFALFVGALAAGMGVKSLAFLGACIWWVFFSRFWARQARDSARHRQLRRRRLERERQGLAPPRGD